MGLVTTLAIVFGVGVLTTNVFGQRLLRRGESYLLKLPVFRVIYAPVKQIVAAFSPENELAFKRVVLIKDPQAGFIFGFLTKEFTLDRRGGCEPVLAVYVPTNHLYLGDVRVFPKNWASYPDLTVQEGVRIFLTGGMAFTAALRVARSVGEAAPALEAARPRPDMAKPDWSRFVRVRKDITVASLGVEAPDRPGARSAHPGRFRPTSNTAERHASVPGRHRTSEQGHDVGSTAAPGD